MRTAIAAISLVLAASVQAAPARVVALQPSLAESVAWVLGPAKISRIAGVTDYADFPPELGRLPSVGSYARFSVEKVASLKPDLVLASNEGNPRDLVEKLRKLGLPVRVVPMGTLQGIADGLEEIARLLGEDGSARPRIAAWRKKLDSLRPNPVKEPAATGVVLQLGDSPLAVAGGKGFLAEALAAAGARNAFADVRLPYHRPSVEAVLARAPSLVLVLQMGSDPAPYEKMRAVWEKRVAGLPAARRPRVRVASIDALLRPGPRILDGIAALREELRK